MIDGQNLKSKHEQGIQKILRMHRSGAGGVHIALALSQAIDTLLHTIFQHLEGNTETLTVVALGGYGRKELCISSDIDVMFLIENEQQRDLTTSAVQEFHHALMDLGLNVGHSFRTLDECLALPEEDYESRISLLEARYLCGDQDIFRRLVTQINKKMKEGDRAAFVKLMTDIRHLRHRKYGNSSKLLEPNIKNSAGGLRDLHTAVWLLRGTGVVIFPKKIKPTETALLVLLKHSVVKKYFTPSFLKEVSRAFDTLLRVRNEMHIQSKSMHDLLEFGLQPRIASQLNFRSRSKRTQVEHFMQEYYTAARSVTLFCSRIIDWANDQWPGVPQDKKITKLDNPFVFRSRRIHITKRRVSLTNELLLRAFLLRSERHAEFSFSFEDAIHRRLSTVKPLSTQTETDLFRLLLHRPNGVGNALRKMNELGLLERWIPEWKPMVFFFQHNQYHYYTADEHTLIVLSNAEALEQSNSSFASVFRSLPRRDTLYLSCLMHDIAKPLHIGKHELRGVPVAKRILQRLRYFDLVEDVSFLVRHHLLMEQVAFRRNLNDPQTIVDFAHTFTRVEQLDFLFVLTYADLSAVNRNVLTEWKELLLRDLYRKARTMLEEEMTGEQMRQRTAQQAEEKRDGVMRTLVPEYPPEEIEEHLAMLSETSYLTAFKPEEMEEHLLKIRSHEDISILIRHLGNYTDITFITRDAPGILSKLCGVLTANDANILDAQVFTRSDGIAIDKFRVSGFISHEALTDQVCARISHDIKEVINGRVDIAHLIERHRMRWKRRVQPINPNVRCDVTYEDHPQYTIIDVYAPDTLGFLYRITETISRLGLNIAFAKIGTRVDGIVDSFYLLDSTGKKVDDPLQREKIRQEILATIRSVSESELVSSTTTT
jgi:[protein-PII] uridylyltransferase